MTGMLPDDVYELTGVADPRISPDGTTVAYVVRGVDREANLYRSAIWLAALDGASEPRRLTSGEKRDAEPRWSPDGSRLAFTSNRSGKVSQLYVMPVDGGEARKLTSLKEDVEHPVWSPDGSAIAFVARVPDTAYDEEDEERRAPRRITRLQYKLEHVGWTVDRPQHLFAVKADGSGVPVQITAGDFEDTAPAWSPDGSTIAFVSARHDDWDVELASDVYLIDAPGLVASANSGPRRLTRGGGQTDGPVWSPDGSRLAVLRYPGMLDDPKHTQVAVVDAVTGDMALLTEALDRNCNPYPTPREPAWIGEHLVFLVEDGGNTHVYRVAVDGSKPPELAIGGERAVTGFDAAAGRLVYTATEPTMLPELFVAPFAPAEPARPGGATEDPISTGTAPADPVRTAVAATEGARRLTRVGEPFAAARELAVAERFTAISADGSEVDAWVMRPVGFEPGRTYPALLNIHGGPYGQYGNEFFDEFQVYAGGGYVVLFSNPRGSSGYSEEWGRAIRGSGELGPGWGSVDYEDCMAVVDEALRRFDFIDPDRLGVIGGSYGGYMTSWIVAHTDRFKAAISERAVNQFVSEWGSSDFGFDFKGYLGAFLYEDIESYLKVSPTTYAENIHTPLMILHSEDDLRCPVEQAEQLFVTLRLLKRPVEMVRFPAESHELTRSGSPVHRVQRFELVLEWFDRYLKD
ncbi:MAG: S9 family peptidase [Thermoleophilia bacterium]|nr:S9 family peptidase [Thermoleophilia bacterium]